MRGEGAEAWPGRVEPRRPVNAEDAPNGERTRSPGLRGVAFPHGRRDHGQRGLGPTSKQAPNSLQGRPLRRPALAAGPRGAYYYYYYYYDYYYYIIHVRTGATARTTTSACTAMATTD